MTFDLNANSMFPCVLKNASNTGLPERDIPWGSTKTAMITDESSNENRREHNISDEQAKQKEIQQGINSISKDSAQILQKKGNQIFLNNKTTLRLESKAKRLV